MLPPTATIIKVTNLLTPYFIRVYETRHYDKKLNSINKKILAGKQMFNNIKSDIKPKIGDSVLVCNRWNATLDLPGWLCRGCISSIQSSENVYNIILVDYGISVVSQRENFIVYTTDFISSEHLSFTVGLYNVLPVTVKDDLSIKEETVIISKEWTSSAIEYIRELISVAETIYFDPLVRDQSGKCYGEFYLNINNNMIRLTETLVINKYAIYLNTGLLQFIENLKNSDNVNKDAIDGETIFYLKISSKLTSTNKLCNVKESRYAAKGNYHNEKHLNSDFERGKEKVFIFGEYQDEYLNSTLDAKFPLKMHKAWKSLMQSSKPRKIQAYIWPAMQKGLDVIAIGTQKAGKTVACTFATCGLLAAHSNLPQGMHPSALILCSSSSKVLEIKSLCTEFLQSYKRIRCVAAINGISERSLVAEMYNGCQILISTPSFLARFMNRNKKLLNFKNVRHLILDDADIILDKYFIPISLLFKNHNVICNRELKNKRLQIVITASYWTQHIKKIASVLLDNPYICITSFVEAAIFKSVHPKVYALNSNRKDDKILDLLGKEYENSRTIIICRDNEEAIKLHNFLAKYKDTLLAHENMDFTHLQGIKQYWDACITGSYPVLIGTDDILSDIGVTNVTWLIHYSVSLQYKTRFSFRFSTLFDNLQAESCNCKVTIFVDENTDIQFLHIIKMMQRMNISIPQNVLKSIELIKESLEKKKRNYPICDSIKSRGFCDKESFCAFRHTIISEIDVPLTKVRINDKVKLRVISVHDVTHISARIISYVKFNTLEEIEFPNAEYMYITMKIQEFYSYIENRKRCEIIDVGSICGLEEPVDTFKRVQILNIDIEQRVGRPKYVNVRCIDNGVILNDVNVYRLLHMPEEIQQYPVQVMEIFLSNVIPHDDEHTWNDCATEAIYQWFKENLDERSYVIGTVNLHLGNTIWVDTLEVGTKLIGYNDVIGSSLRTELLKQDHAIASSEHLRRIYQLCKDTGLLEINGYDLNS